jgi:hypothetical protein
MLGVLNQKFQIARRLEHATFACVKVPYDLGQIRNSSHYLDSATVLTDSCILFVLQGGSCIELAGKVQALQLCIVIPRRGLLIVAYSLYLLVSQCSEEEKACRSVTRACHALKYNYHKISIILFQQSSLLGTQFHLFTLQPVIDDFIIPNPSSLMRPEL